MNGLKLSIALAALSLMGCATSKDMPFPFSHDNHSNVESVEMYVNTPEPHVTVGKLEQEEGS